MGIRRRSNGYGIRLMPYTLYILSISFLPDSIFKCEPLNGSLSHDDPIVCFTWAFAISRFQRLRLRNEDVLSKSCRRCEKH
jgi:hypothetical protein